MKLIDANIFMYAAGSEHPNKSKSLRFLRKLSRPKVSLEYCTNIEVIKEIFHQYQSLNRFEVAASILETIVSRNIEILPIEFTDLVYCHQLIRNQKNLSGRDAIHAAFIQRNSLQGIVSFDKDFDELDGILREEPR